ncbi:AglZ/HisF2 family acetamidino modification protein [Laspinema olomoucense]|uniref:AglZ/HisF2 family acetamidino modification protein n=1 Tax=Laspinema olomoucense TaxID=3231600 RepID=UPI0021BA3C9E|nr:AglZ/HisF2 family acetamidino modification protein [Laspinema sp. D3c]MCT7995234.1 AglZ/HisF2 family acetamidino modification protein [Laspinema sp. D3c]
MTLPRVIPCLLLRGEGLYKSRNFKDWKYVGDPRNAIRIFNEKEVDELILLDVEATRQSKAIQWQLIEECAGECFMPLAYGGAVDSSETARRLVSLGIEKVVVNSTALDRPELIREISQQIGTCSTVVCIDVKRDWRGQTYVYDYRSRRKLSLTPLQWASKAVELGAGELIIQSVDRDGCFNGYDLDRLQEITTNVSVPVTTLGGGASLDHCTEAWQRGASGVGAGSWFVFQPPHRAVLITYPEYKKIRSAFEQAQS